MKSNKDRRGLVPVYMKIVSIPVIVLSCFLSLWFALEMMFGDVIHLSLFGMKHDGSVLHYKMFVILGVTFYHGFSAILLLLGKKLAWVNCMYAYSLTAIFGLYVFVSTGFAVIPYELALEFLMLYGLLRIRMNWNEK